MNDRFIWHDGELEEITKEDLKKLGYVSYIQSENKYSCKLCSQNSFCGHNCENYYPIADKIAKSIFNKYFNDDANIGTVNKIFGNLIEEMKSILSPEITLTKGLYICSKIRLIKLIEDETLIDIPLDIKSSIL